MANAITLFKKYVDRLDEVYKRAALSSILDSPADIVREGANANEIIIPKMSLSGLADYSRNNGYVGGDVTLTNETVQFNYDRGRKFGVDAMDDEETAGVAFGRLAGEFVRTKVAPEGDAFTFATMAGASGIGSTSAALSTGADVIAALRTATNAMDEAEVDEAERVLFITPTLRGMIADLDTNKSREVLERFGDIVRVPQTRFYSAIKLNDGTTSGEEIGGYTKATGAKNLNFLVVQRSAVIKYDKHIVNKVVRPEDNQSADQWLFFYRKYGLVDVYENKVAGIYAHLSTT